MSMEGKTSCNSCKEIMEIYIGMDGFIAKTALEAYQQHILKQMYDCAVKCESTIFKDLNHGHKHHVVKIIEDIENDK